MADAAGPELKNPLLERLRAGGLGIMLIVRLVRTGEIALAAKTCGYDAINIDLEHSTITEAEAAQISISAIAAGLTPLVRVPPGAPVGRILDAGALGIIFPHVETADDARAAVRACKYPPLGDRSASSSLPHFAYASHPTAKLQRAVDGATMVIAMLETKNAVDRADEIAAVEGVDIVHIGTNDLCADLGIPGQFGHPSVEDAYRRVVAACRKHGKFAGMGGIGPEKALVEKFIGLGVRFMTAGNEWQFMMAAARARAQELRTIPV